MYVSLRLMKSPARDGGSRHSAAEYSEMASSYRLATTAASPRHSSFLEKHCLKSGREIVVSTTIPYTRYARLLAKNPFRLPGECILTSQFALHLMETFGGIRYLVQYIELFTDGPIDCEFRGSKLQINKASSPQRTPEERHTHVSSGRQGVFPRTTSQFYFCPLSQERCGG